MKNRSKKEVNIVRHLGIDFSSILVDFGNQLGRQNCAKIYQKWHRKNDEKKKGAKMAKKSLQGPAKHRGRGFPGPRGGGRGKGLDGRASRESGAA